MLKIDLSLDWLDVRCLTNRIPQIVFLIKSGPNVNQNTKAPEKNGNDLKLNGNKTKRNIFAYGDLLGHTNTSQQLGRQSLRGVAGLSDLPDFPTPL